MIDVALKLTDIWTPAGIILSFQVTLFSWRLKEEAAVGDKGEIPWLVPSDYVNLCGMLVLVFGAYLLPMAGLLSPSQGAAFCGLGALLFTGHAFSLAGHYQLFNRSKHRKFVWFPVQERVALLLTVLSAIAYLCLALPRAFHA